MQLSRRSFLTYTAGGALSLVLVDATGARRVLATGLPGGTLPASQIQPFVSPLLVPPTMPRTRRIGTVDGPVDYYEISVRQFAQQVLPPGHPPTTVWGYGPDGAATGVAHSAPSMTIEAEHGVPVRIRWVNRLVDDQGRYLRHLLPVDPTLHWANPGRVPGHDGVPRTDTRPDYGGRTFVPPGDLTDPQTQYTTYQGPVPVVVHLHGAMGMGDESDGYPEAWFLPDAWDVTDEFARAGTWWDFFSAKARTRFGVRWNRGEMVAQYPNGNRDSTLWFHDHALGITRLNVYAGPAGFYLLRGGEHGEDRVRDARTGRRAVLPGPRPQQSPGRGEEAGEIPLAIQDRSFNADGSLFYPDTRAFFDGYPGPYLPDTPVPPVWNPEFFGSTIIVNGQTWPYLDVRRRRYRLRLLNGCGSRFLILDFSQLGPGLKLHQIGNDGGFLEAPHDLAEDNYRLLLGPAERADVIADLTGVAPGDYELLNVGPDEPFGGGEPGDDFEPADPATTGRVLQLRVRPARGADRSTPAEHLVLPGVPASAVEVRTRKLALLEHLHEVDGETGEEAPVAAHLGVVDTLGGSLVARPLTWADDVTENPRPGDTEVWEIFNLTADAHPIHVHETPFEVLSRAPLTVDEESGEVLAVGDPVDPAPGEGGRKDTVVSFPATVTRIRMTFRNAGQFVWHCHVLEHEDNEMMRAYRVGDPQPGQPGGAPHGH